MVDWISERIEVLAFALAIGLVMGLAAYAFAWAINSQERQIEQQIGLCVQAFAYTRDQCEFIVRNGVVPMEGPRR